LLKSISFVFPFFNRDSYDFELSLKSLEQQTVPVDEIILVDYASDKPHCDDIADVCDRYGVDRIYLHQLEGTPPNYRAIYFWNTGANAGIRKAKSDLIFYTGIDKMFHPETVEEIFNGFNESTNRVYHGKAVNFLRQARELDLNTITYDSIFNECKWRGGYAYHCATREWWHKIRGVDEVLKWYGDIDLARRVKLDKLGTYWGKPVIHLAMHPSNHRVYDSKGGVMLRRIGKKFIARNSKVNRVVRNDETWGMLTEKKFRRAMYLEMMK